MNSFQQTPPNSKSTELTAWLRLCLTPGIGNVSARQLLRTFGQVEAVFEASFFALRQVVSERQCENLLETPPELNDLVTRTQAWLDSARPEQQRRLITLGDTFYPPAFLNLADPPLMIHAMGAPAAFNTLLQPHALAVVGSRNPTPAGLDNAFAFSQHLAQQGVMIVSGLARGIDGAAHQGALQSGHVGATVALVGTGLDRVYPQAHHSLAQRIAQQGLLISEYPLGTPPLAANFPKRNRLIAALSQGVLVVEAGLPSGSLVTAELGLEQGKEVFAIPGSIHSPASRGCHALIKQGAKLIEKAQDILDELPQLVSTTSTTPPLYPPTQAPDSSPVPAASDDEAVLTAMGHEGVDLDTLQARCGWATPALQAALMRLELADRIGRLGNGQFQRRGRT